MKAEITKHRPKTILMCELEVGQVGMRNGDPILGIFGPRWVNLNDPERTWSGEPQLTVELLDAGTEITLTVED